MGRDTSAINEGTGTSDDCSDELQRNRSGGQMTFGPQRLVVDHRADNKKGPPRELVSRRAGGFAGIRIRNKNRVSRPPAILRVLDGSGCVSSGGRRGLPFVFDLALFGGRHSLLYHSYSTESSSTLIKETAVPATNPGPPRDRLTCVNERGL